jgi:hypothetical protein
MPTAAYAFMTKISKWMKSVESVVSLGVATYLAGIRAIPDFDGGRVQALRQADRKLAGAGR